MRPAYPFYLLALLVCLGVGLMPVGQGLDLDQERPRTITVSVQGGVSQPRAVTLPVYATIGDALDKFDLTEDADLSAVNRLDVLKDGDVIVVPQLSHRGGLISINYADEELLQTVTGIGPVMAGRIVAYRQAHGLYQNLEGLLDVKGIGERTLVKITPFLCL